VTNESCEFCRVVSRQDDSTIIFEDEKTMVFMDIKPVIDGHTLVIPKAHYENIFEIPEDEIAYVHKIVKRMATAVKKAMKADGISIIQHNGKAAMQRVFHLHVHVVPRYKGQKMPRPEELITPSKEKLEEIAERIRQYV
jgi:histidine triad (HIT) family protein